MFSLSSIDPESMEIKSIASPRVEFDGDDDEPQFSNLRSGMLPPQNAMVLKGTEWYKTCYQDGRREKSILDMIKSSLTLLDVGEFLLLLRELNLLKKNSNTDR